MSSIDIFTSDDPIYGELIVLAARGLYPDWWLSKLEVRQETLSLLTNDGIVKEEIL